MLCLMDCKIDDERLVFYLHAYILCTSIYPLQISLGVASAILVVTHFESAIKINK